MYFHFEENDNVNSENNEQKSAYYIKIILSFLLIINIILNILNIYFFNLLSLIIHLSFISSSRTLIS